MSCTFHTPVETLAVDLLVNLSLQVTYLWVFIAASTAAFLHFPFFFLFLKEYLDEGKPLVSRVQKHHIESLLAFLWALFHRGSLSCCIKASCHQVVTDFNDLDYKLTWDHSSQIVTSGKSWLNLFCYEPDRSKNVCDQDAWSNYVIST